jgi:hypothetical protein
MPIKNYTTKVNEHRSVAEIQGTLAGKGARSIVIDYDNGIPLAVRFTLLLQDQLIPFRLPCNVDGVFRAIAGEYKDRYARAKYERNPANREHARWIAWRIVKDWVEAQMAIVEAEQAELAQVFLPYAVVGQEGLTVYEQFLSANANRQLAAAPEEVCSEKQ